MPSSTRKTPQSSSLYSLPSAFPSASSGASKTHGSIPRSPNVCTNSSQAPTSSCCRRQGTSPWKIAHKKSPQHCSSSSPTAKYGHDNQPIAWLRCPVGRFQQSHAGVLADQSGFGRFPFQNRFYLLVSASAS